MTKDEKRLEDCVDEAQEIISRYSIEQAVEDGVLFDVNELRHVAPEYRWDKGLFSHVTANLCYSKGYLKDGEEPKVNNFLDLFRTMQEHMKQTGPDHFYSTDIEFPDGTRGDVYARLNEIDRYTILLPEDD